MFELTWYKVIPSQSLIHIYKLQWNNLKYGIMLRKMCVWVWLGIDDKRLTIIITIIITIMIIIIIIIIMIKIIITITTATTMIIKSTMTKHR